MSSRRNKGTSDLLFKTKLKKNIISDKEKIDIERAISLSLTQDDFTTINNNVVSDGRQSNKLSSNFLKNGNNDDLRLQQLRSQLCKVVNRRIEAVAQETQLVKEIKKLNKSMVSKKRQRIMSNPGVSNNQDKSTTTVTGSLFQNERKMIYTSDNVEIPETRHSNEKASRWMASHGEDDRILNVLLQAQQQDIIISNIEGREPSRMDSENYIPSTTMTTTTAELGASLEEELERYIRYLQDLTCQKNGDDDLEVGLRCIYNIIYLLGENKQKIGIKLNNAIVKCLADVSHQFNQTMGNITDNALAAVFHFLCKQIGIVDSADDGGAAFSTGQPTVLSRCSSSLVHVDSTTYASAVNALPMHSSLTTHGKSHDPSISIPLISVDTAVEVVQRANDSNIMFETDEACPDSSCSEKNTPVMAEVQLNLSILSSPMPNVCGILSVYQVVDLSQDDELLVSQGGGGLGGGGGGGGASPVVIDLTSSASKSPCKPHSPNSPAVYTQLNNAFIASSNKSGESQCSTSLRDKESAGATNSSEVCYSGDSSLPDGCIVYDPSPNIAVFELSGRKRKYFGRGLEGGRLQAIEEHYAGDRDDVDLASKSSLATTITASQLYGDDVPTSQRSQAVAPVRNQEPRGDVSGAELTLRPPSQRTLKDIEALLEGASQPVLDSLTDIEIKYLAKKFGLKMQQRSLMLKLFLSIWNKNQDKASSRHVPRTLAESSTAGAWQLPKTIMCSSSLTSTAASMHTADLTPETLIHFLKSDAELYERVVTFQSIDADQLYQKLLASQMFRAVLKQRLLAMLDDLNVFVTYGAQSGHGFSASRAKQKTTRK